MDVVGQVGDSGDRGREGELCPQELCGFRTDLLESRRLGERGLRVAAHLAAAEEAERRPLPAERDVFRNAQRGNQIHFLIDGADAELLSVPRRPRIDRLAVERQVGDLLADLVGQD